MEKQICLPVITRWYSRYNCAKSLLDNKGVISLLAIDGVIEDVRSQQAAKRDSFLGIVRDPQFWEGLSRFESEQLFESIHTHGPADEERVL